MGKKYCTYVKCEARDCESHASKTESTLGFLSFDYSFADLYKTCEMYTNQTIERVKTC